MITDFGSSWLFCSRSKSPVWNGKVSQGRGKGEKLLKTSRGFFFNVCHETKIKITTETIPIILNEAAS